MMFRCADAATARHILCRRDEFVRRTTGCERSLRLGTRRSVTVAAYLDRLYAGVREWDPAESRRLQAAAALLAAALADNRFPAEEDLLFIKTDGREEWNSAYTRGNAVVIPEGKFRSYHSARSLFLLIAHEYYHIVTRRHPRLRDTLNALIGYYPAELETRHIPPALKRRMLTNPDSLFPYYARAAYKGKPVRAVPLTLLKEVAEGIDPARDILASLETRYWVVPEPPPAGGADGGQERCLTAGELAGLPAAAEEKSADPEEILAGRFALLLEGKEIEGAERLRDAVRGFYATRSKHEGS